MKKVKLAVKNINERRFAITDLEFSEALKDRELLLQFCVQILQVLNCLFLTQDQT
jgi:hypothetical protein